MKLAVSTYSLAKWRSEHRKTLAQSFEVIRSLGVDAVEIAGNTDVRKPVVHDPVRRAKELRRAAENRGLAVCSYCIGANLLVPRKEQRKEIDRIKVEVEAAAALGVPSMRHDVGWGFDRYKNYRGQKTVEAAIDIVKDAIREVTEHAQSLGVVTSLENHGFFFQAGTVVERLLKAVNHPNFRLTIDLGNFLCVNDDPVKATRRLAKYVVMAHAKDFHVKPKERSPGEGWFNTPTDIALRGAVAGHGVLDLPAQLKILRDAGYDRYLSLEFEGIEEPVKAVRMGLDYLRKVLATPR
ncbi:MAG: TIM barrel protein [Phycisphaera sp.]|nr:TIM barrel protein [Phycisphaera sp.]